MPTIHSPAGSPGPRPSQVERYTSAGPSTARGFTGANWTSIPSLHFEDAVVETVVTHVTRTTTSFAPLKLPPIPMPEAIKLPTHLAQEQYPLAHEPTPDDMKWFTMKVGEQRVVISEDGPLKSPPTPSDTNGAGWQRALPASIAGGGMTLVDALNGTRGKGKRSHQTFAPQEPLSSSQLTPAGSMENLSSSVYPSPPRKRIRRPEDTRTPIPVETSGAPLSPLPSPELETPPPAASPSTIPLGPGHELAALYSLPSMLNHFDGLPDKLQQHVLMHMLRRSRMPTIQRIATFTTSAIKRDMISCLPREISVQILKCVDAKTLATSTRVCKKWKHIIDSERSVWKQRLIEDQLYCGQGVEEEDEAVLEKRFERIEDRNKQAESLRKAEADDWKRDYIAPPEMERSVPLKHVYRRRQQTQENWFNKRPVHNSFPGHGTNVITCLQFDRDKIISASDDNCINVYHTATGKIKKRLEGHEGGVWALQYRGDTLVTGSTDRSVRVWCLKTMRLTHTFTGHTSTVRCLTIVEPVLDEKTGKYFPPYPLIVTGSRDASLRVWKLPQRGEPNVVKWGVNAKGERELLPVSPEENPYHLFALTGHTDAIRALACDGRYCVSGSYDTTVRVWDIVKGKCLHILGGHEQKVYSIVYDRYRHRAASGSMDNTVKIWDLKTGTCLHTLMGHTSLVGLLGLSPNHLVSAAADSSLRVWNAEDLSIQHVLRNNGGAITCFRHDEDKVISGSDGMLKLWDIRRGKFVRDLVIGISSVWQVGIKGNLLVAASNRGGTTVFDVFDFGALNHPSGVDNEDLDFDSWENKYPRPSVDVEMRKRGHLRDYELDPDILKKEQEERDAALEDMYFSSSDDEDDGPILDDDGNPLTYPFDREPKRATIICNLRPIVIDARPKHLRKKDTRRSTRIARKSSEGPAMSPLKKNKTLHPRTNVLEKLAAGPLNLTTGRAQALRAAHMGPAHRAAASTSTSGAGPSVPRQAVAVPAPCLPPWFDTTTTPKAVSKSTVGAMMKILEQEAEGKGKGKSRAKMPMGHAHASGSGGHNESPSKPGQSRPISINTRVTRSRSGPGSSSPAKIARTSSAGQLSGSANSKKRTFLPVFDDDEVEEELEDAPRMRTRILREEEDDDELESDSDEDEDEEEDEEEGEGVEMVIDGSESEDEDEDDEMDGDIDP